MVRHVSGFPVHTRVQEGEGMYRETTDMSNHVYRREWVCTGKPLTSLTVYTGGSVYVQGNQ